MLAIAGSIGEPDIQGLVGRNRTAGELLSVRFQYGAGRAWRHGLASGDADMARQAERAVLAGLRSAGPDGRFVSRLPVGVEGVAGPGTQASAAAFFLSDACPAFSVATLSQADRDSLSRSLDRMAESADALMRHDRHAPNRLLIDALAFHACGRVLGRADIAGHADPFLGHALGFLRANGVMEEAGGADTSYQAVSLVAAATLLDTGYEGPFRDRLEAFRSDGSRWLAARIRPDGALDSRGNTRSCAGERFLGRPKDVDLREVFRALALGELGGLVERTTVERYRDWLATRPGPCT